MAVVASVAINLDSRGVQAKLKQIRQAASNLDRSFKGLQGSASEVKSAIQAQQGGFAKASTVQGVFSARVLNTEKAIRAQISALREVQSSVKLNGALYQKAGQQIKQYEDVLRSSNKEEERGIGIKQRAGKALSGMRGTLLSIGAGAAVSTAFGDAQALALAQKRLARLTEEYEQFAGAQQEAERLANKFELSVTDTAGALSNLGSRLGAQGVTLEEIVAVYEGMNSALVATGRSASEASSASYQLAQALGSGSLTGDELKTISETLPELLNAVAAAAGKSSTEIRAMAKEGALSADLIIKATKTLRDKYEGDVAANITQTQKFRNALGGLSEAIGTELAPSITVLLEGATEMLKLFGKLPGPVKTLTAAAIGLTAAFVALAPAISAVIGLIGSATLIAAAPWVAVAAGVTALAVAAYDGTVRAQEFQNKLNDLGGTSTELQAKMAGVRDDMAELSEEIAKGGRAGAVAKKKYDALAETLKNLEGTYKVRIEIEELFNGGTPNEKLPAGYSRAKDGRLLNTVSGVTYDVATGAVYTPPKETPKVGDTVGGGAAAKSKRGGKDTAADAAKRATEAGKSLLDQQQRRLKLLQLQSPLEKQLLQIEFDRLDAQKQIENISPSQRPEAEIQANTIAQMEAGFAIGESLAQSVIAESDKTKAIEDQLRPLQEQRRLLEAQLDGRKEEEELLIQIENATRGLAPAESQRVENLIRGNAALEDQLNQVDLLNESLEGAANIIGNQLRGAIDGLIDGTANWNNILRDTLSQLGSFLLNAGLNQLAGPSGSPGILSFLGFGTRANGGPVRANSTYLVGERGPELLSMGNQNGYVHSNTSAAMDRYRSSDAPAANRTVNVNYSVTEINGMRFVTEDQFRAGMNEAAKNGASMGERRTINTLKNSRSQRSKLGL